MLEILGKFVLDGEAVCCDALGRGHINRSFLAKTDRGHLYLLQWINNAVFRDVPALMENVSRVTRHLQGQGLGRRQVLTLVPARDGRDYILFESSDPALAGYYRVYEYITDSLCMDLPETPDDFRQTALAFGRFQMQLADFPAESLTETIPRFHDTVDRFRQLHQAVGSDPLGRAKEVREEIDFALAREEIAGTMLNMLRSGDLPLRVTHNDTKTNNVMLDAKTREPLCVVDLDTVMPGLSGNDFGDSIRFGASSSPEDERDLSKVHFRLAYFRAFANGFLGACGGALTAAEVETLPLGAKLMTLECGIRFLTDHLNGDKYFRIHRPGQNLDRARTQLKLVAEMEEYWDGMHAVIREEAAAVRN